MGQTPPVFPTEDPHKSCGFLMQDVARLMRRNFNRRVEEEKLGLTQAQWQALAHISRNQGMRQATLADILEAQPITIARLIDRMAANGWVERRPDPTDRRAVGLYLTEKVYPIIAAMSALGVRTRGEAMSGFTQADKDMLVDLLTRMRSNLISSGEKS